MTEEWMAQAQDDLDAALAQQQTEERAQWEAEQQKDEREVRLLRLVQESRELLTDKAQAFADDNWELVYLRAILKADAELREIFMSGVRAGIEMMESREGVKEGPDA